MLLSRLILPSQNALDANLNSTTDTGLVLTNSKPCFLFEIPQSSLFNSFEAFALLIAHNYKYSKNDPGQVRYQGGGAGSCAPNMPPPHEKDKNNMNLACFNRFQATFVRDFETGLLNFVDCNGIISNPKTCPVTQHL